MKMCDVNPHIRFASEVRYKSEYKSVFVRDCRMFYILSGSGEIVIENKHYNLRPNSFFYCCGESIYGIESKSGMTLIVINFDFDQSRNWRTMSFPLIDSSQIGKIKREMCMVEDSDFLGGHFFSADAKEIYAKINTIAEEFAAQKLYYNERSSALLKELIITLHRGAFHKSENAAETVSFIIEYINNNYKKKFENKELALLAGYHEYHLNRLFIKYTGLSLHKYILTKRMTEAKKLLLNTSMPLAEIAEGVGFGNNTYFSYYFKKEYEISPSDYRKKFKNTI